MTEPPDSQQAAEFLVLVCDDWLRWLSWENARRAA
jgi:hypothetical protein